MSGWLTSLATSFSLAASSACTRGPGVAGGVGEGVEVAGREGGRGAVPGFDVLVETAALVPGFDVLVEAAALVPGFDVLVEAAALAPGFDVLVEAAALAPAAFRFSFARVRDADFFLFLLTTRFPAASTAAASPGGDRGRVDLADADEAARRTAELGFWLSNTMAPVTN